MILTQKRTLFGLTAIVLIASLAFAEGGRGTRDAQDGHHRRMHARMERRGHVRAFLRQLAFTDAQKAQALQAAQTVQPIAESARARARKIVQDARQADPKADKKTIHAAVKDQVKAVRAEAATQILPSARALLATLTPEQRAKIQAALERHGKTFDEDRAARRLGFLLSRPRAVQFLQPRTPR